MRISGDWLESVATQVVCQMLAGAGHQVLFVGGCVRNALLEEPVKDIDIATDALPEEVTQLAKRSQLKAIPTGLDHGTITVVSEGVPFEITTFRKDVETFGRHAVVAFSTDVTDDARRRDFTMNALYAQPDGTVVDPLNGLLDLQARRFRFIEDAAARIQEDYLRILRFFRFNAWYGSADAGLDSEALAAIAENLDGLSGLSRERVGAEMLKLLAATNPAFAVASMRNTGVLNAVLPGSDDRVLASLVHLEAETSTPPAALRRLAALGGQRVAERLRLSKAQAKELNLIRGLVGNLMSPAEMGYRHGERTGRDVMLLCAALMETPLPAKALVEMAEGAAAHFPLTAADFQPEYSGPALGEALKDAERRWIKSGFSRSREDLLKDGDGA